MVYLHKESFSPDPTYGRCIPQGDGNWHDVELYPHDLRRITPLTPEAESWGATLNIQKKPRALTLLPDAERRAELLLDFGTETDGELCLTISSRCAVNLMACFGESEPEAAGLVPGHFPNPTLYWHVEKGTQTIQGPARGFRFVRLVVSDMTHHVTLKKISVRARLTFRERKGDFSCSDKRFQRVWQTSIYTARVCTKADTIWDGIKRDRHGWYGDARVTKLANDNAFFDPVPAEAMLLAMPTNQWANGIPNYAFDGIAMLKQHILYFGTERPCVRPCYTNIKKLLAWAERTQVDKHGMLVRREQYYFGGMGFLDWSDMPSGGRFEELSWLQIKYLEALRTTHDIAVMLKDHKTAARLAPRITSFTRLLRRRFWDAQKGFIHTLNHIGRPGPLKGASGWNYDPCDTLHMAIHYHKTYVEKVRLGRSEASRHCNALAVLAGLTDGAMNETIRERVFDNPAIPPIVTAYFTYFEQMARGLCGDPAGAIMQFRDYVGTMLEREDAATIWEVYRPDVTDIQKYFGNGGPLWTWPYSLCHGWGAGAVPVATRFLLGIEPVAPAFGVVTLDPCITIPWTFSATVPTPHGHIRVKRQEKDGPVQYYIPRAIEVTPETETRIGENIRITRDRS